jgi:hypothetical protein
MVAPREPMGFGLPVSYPGDSLVLGFCNNLGPRERGLTVSPAGVRSAWLRHDLETKKTRG